MSFQQGIEGQSKEDKSLFVCLFVLAVSCCFYFLEPAIKNTFLYGSMNSKIILGSGLHAQAY